MVGGKSHQHRPLNRAVDKDPDHGRCCEADSPPLPAACRGHLRCHRASIRRDGGGVRPRGVAADALRIAVRARRRAACRATTRADRSVSERARPARMSHLPTPPPATVGARPPHRAFCLMAARLTGRVHIGPTSPPMLSGVTMGEGPQILTGRSCGAEVSAGSGAPHEKPSGTARAPDLLRGSRPLVRRRGDAWSLPSERRAPAGRLTRVRPAFWDAVEV